MANPPGVFVSGPAAGYYGNTGDRLVDEGSPPGGDFLARLCVDWESATEPEREPGSVSWRPAPASCCPGELGRELAAAIGYASQRVLPGVLAGSGFRFRWAHLDEALANVLG